MGIRTDLALEAEEIYKESSKEEISGITSKYEKDGDVKITSMEIKSEEAEKILGRKKGNYITIEAPKIEYSTEDYEKACEYISKNISKLIGDVKNSTILVVGLGNDEITPDALGPMVVSKLIVTRHMKKKGEALFSEGFSNVCAIAPGVLGTTGIESADIIKGIVKNTKADVVIAVDALASRSMDRVNTTIQICDSGIEPGAGIGNRRDALNEETLGAKVIAIGVPTVIDAYTIANDTLLHNENLSQNEREILINKGLSQNIKNLVVTPRNIDLVMKRASKTIANGLNMALHQGLSFKDVESFVM